MSKTLTEVMKETVAEILTVAVPEKPCVPTDDPNFPDDLEPVIRAEHPQNVVQPSTSEDEGEAEQVAGQEH